MAQGAKHNTNNFTAQEDDDLNRLCCLLMQIKITLTRLCFKKNFKGALFSEPVNSKKSRMISMKKLVAQEQRVMSQG